jgi:ribosomal subunit interface protein
MLRLTISNVHSEVDKDLDKYVTKKIGRLDKYIPRQVRDSAHAEVFLKEEKIKQKSQCTCEIIMHLPHSEFATKETTLNIFAAVDIVETKLKNQLRKYKQKHTARPRILNLMKHKRKNTTI